MTNQAIPLVIKWRLDAFQSPRHQYLEGSPDYVEPLLEKFRKFIVLHSAGSVNHFVRESQSVHGDSLGPSIVLEHSSKKGCEEKQC